MSLDYGHWDVSNVGNFLPTDHYGFIYLATNTTSGKMYIGRKSLWSTTTRKVWNVAKTAKKSTKVFKESDWRKYTTSSAVINAEIDAGAKFAFQILSLHNNKGSLAYAEIEQMVLRDVLRAKNIMGDRTYYNNAIGNMKFALTEDKSAAHKKALAKAMVGNKNAVGGNQQGIIANHSEASKKKISESQKARHARNKLKEESDQP